MAGHSIIDRIRPLYRHLLATLPPPTAVRLRHAGQIIHNGMICNGITSWGASGVATISISIRCDRERAEETLLHEYAHVLDGCPPQDCLHPESWGKQYAKVYAVWMRFVAER